MVYQKKDKGKTEGVKKYLTVQWIVVNKKLIKFIEEGDKLYKLADNVIEYLDEIKANVPVNVTIVDDKVIFIQKREGEVVSKDDVVEEVKETNEEPQEKTADEMVYTVKAISKTRDYYLFDEVGEKEWFAVASNVKNFLKDVKKGDVLEVKIEVSNNGKRDVKTIVFAKVKSVKEESKQETKNEIVTNTKKPSYRDEESTDKRTALMTAKDLVVALINSSKIENKQVKSVLNELTKACYENIKSL